MEGCLQQETEEDGRKYAFCIVKAFGMAMKVSQYVDGMWGSFITARDAVTTVKSEEVSLESEAISPNSALRRALHLWYLLLSRALDYCGLTCNENVVLDEGWSVACAPVISLLQLSIMSLQGLQDSVACVDDLLKRGNLQIDILHWIMSRASVMASLFLNSKDYESACLLLRVAYDAGWAMVEARTKKALIEPADDKVNDSDLNSCMKRTVLLASCLEYSGKNEACIETLEDGLLRWATIHSTLSRLGTVTPFSVVHVRTSVLQEYEWLNNFIKTRNQTLHRQTIDLLLGEELLSFQELEDRHVDGIESLKLQMLRSNSSSVSRFVNVPKKTVRKVLESLPNSECILCWSKFSVEQKRGCMVPCGHASACFECATKAWEKKPFCPWCQAFIEKLIPLPRLFF